VFRLQSGATHGLADVEDFLSLLNDLPEEIQPLFDPEQTLYVARAPGRLDMMGGIADYSGSLVLQLPIARATHAAVALTTDRCLRIVSLASDRPPRFFETEIDAFRPEGSYGKYSAARGNFRPENHWAAYVAGAFTVLGRERGVQFDRGARVLIFSEVPEGKGVSSSAALEVATMKAIAAAYEIAIDPRELAFLCQKVENLVVGAPCGVMDQMASACGEPDQLLAILCQPGEIKGTVEIPRELRVWGIDSGVRHSVSGADYGTVRTAAFMGYRIIAEAAGLSARVTTAGRVMIDDPRWNGYLANLTPDEFAKDYADRLPQQMSGKDFLDRFHGVTDKVTSIDPLRDYPVFQATRHPIEEHARVRRFASILNDWRGPDQARELGALMIASHESYSACGLGSEATDELVQLVQNAGEREGLFGAKITGGGSGGAVAVLGLRDAEDAVRETAQEYQRRSGRTPMLITGSSPGAELFGVLKLKKES
jgi:galactokinase